LRCTIGELGIIKKYQFVSANVLELFETVQSKLLDKTILPAAGQGSIRGMPATDEDVQVFFPLVHISCEYVQGSGSCATRGATNLDRPTTDNNKVKPVVGMNHVFHEIS
jgi:hypothetical protein